jgi:hypothetical protein
LLEIIYNAFARLCHIHIQYRKDYYIVNSKPYKNSRQKSFMEETVWLYFSVIAIIFAFGIIAVLYSENKEDQKYQAFRSALDSLASQCDYVCGTGTGTNLPSEVSLPSGMLLYAHDKKICGTLEGENRCSMCSCQLMNYTLDLNTTFAREVLEIHKYQCFFRRTIDGEEMECQG